MVPEIAFFVLLRLWTNRIIICLLCWWFAIVFIIECKNRLAHLNRYNFILTDVLIDSSERVLHALDIAETIEGSDLGVLNLEAGAYLLKCA